MTTFADLSKAPGVRTLWAQRDPRTHEVTWCVWSSTQGVSMEMIEEMLDNLHPAFTRWQVLVSEAGTPSAQVMVVPVEHGEEGLDWEHALKQARIYARML